MSAAPPTIDLAALAPPTVMPDALRRWHGFVPLFPASFSRHGAPYWRLAEDAAAAWTRHDIPAQPIPPLGCAFLHDVELFGSGYPFHAGRFIREAAHTSGAGLDWLADPDWHDHPLTRPRRNAIRIEEPVLLVFGPGSSIYGHWLLDFLPRIAIARMLLGARLDAFVLPLPADTPGWVMRMIETFCGIAPARIRPFDRFHDRLICPRLCLPSFAHHGDYALHPLARQFYSRFRPDIPTGGARRLCLSRRGQERNTISYPRIFEARALMEEIAVARGYEIVTPETLSFPEQVALFRSAGRVVSEYGSGPHGTIFSAPGTVVGMAGWYSHIQMYLSAACAQPTLFMSRIAVLEDAHDQPFRFTAERADLIDLFDRVEATPVKRGG